MHMEDGPYEDVPVMAEAVYLIYPARLLMVRSSAFYVVIKYVFCIMMGITET